MRADTIDRAIKRKKIILCLSPSTPACSLSRSHTCSGCSSLIACLSDTRSHRLGGARPVSLSRTPHASSTRFASVLSSASAAFSLAA